MWFDVSAAVVRLQANGEAQNVIRMTESNAPKVAEIAKIADPHAQKPKTVPVVRTDGLKSDAGGYLDFLNLHGPSTSGACAAALGWGATRAWQAEAQLWAAKLLRYDRLGKAVMTPDQSAFLAPKNQCLNPPVAPGIRVAMPKASGNYCRTPNAGT